MINITLPDNSIKAFEAFPTGMDVAKTISEGFARSCVAMEVDGQPMDLSCEITCDCGLKFITTRDEEALEILRHSAAHVMAEAIQNLYQRADLTIGPVVEDGFYYDIDMDPVSEEDFPAIEAEMQKIIKAKKTFERTVGYPRTRPLPCSRITLIRWSSLRPWKTRKFPFTARADLRICAGAPTFPTPA